MNVRKKKILFLVFVNCIHFFDFLCLFTIQSNIYHTCFSILHTINFFFPKNTSFIIPFLNYILNHLLQFYFLKQLSFQHFKILLWSYSAIESIFQQRLFILKAIVLQGLLLRHLFFVVYINHLLEKIISDVKIFIDDNNLFSIINCASASALNMNFLNMQDWEYHWNMSFNLDQTNQTKKLC